MAGSRRDIPKVVVAVPTSRAVDFFRPTPCALVVAPYGRRGCQIRCGELAVEPLPVQWRQERAIRQPPVEQIGADTPDATTAEISTFGSDDDLRRTARAARSSSAKR